MRSLTKYIFLTATMFCLGAQATNGFIDNSTSPAPKLLLDAAVTSLASKKQISAADIMNGYQIEWTFIVVYDDDQPMLFLFTNEKESCFLEMGSDSLSTKSVVCH